MHLDTGRYTPEPRPSYWSYPEAIALKQVWTALKAGEVHIVSWGHTSEECFLELERTDQQKPSHRTRQFDMAERLMSGCSEKVVGLEAGVAPSTVACRFALAMKALGITCTLHTTPLLLIMAVHAASGRPTGFTSAWLFRSSENAGRRFTVSAPRPDMQLTTVLPREQLNVLRLMIEGRSQRQIAEMRGRSTRTIANQLSFVYQRLGARGRNEIIAWLLMRSASVPPLARMILSSDSAPHLEPPLGTDPIALESMELDVVPIVPLLKQIGPVELPPSSTL